MRGRPKVAYFEDDVPDENFRRAISNPSPDDESPVIAFTRGRQKTKEDRTPADKPQG